MNKIIIILTFSLVFLAMDYYVWQAIKILIKGINPRLRKIIRVGFWSVTAFTVFLLVAYHTGMPEKWGRGWNTFIMVFIFMNYFSKAFGVVFLLLDDIRRFFIYVKKLFFARDEDSSNASSSQSSEKISRSEFMGKAALIATSIPLISMGYGIISGAHDYRVIRQRVRIPKLPAAFEGLRIAQVSDIHTGSFFNPTAVKGGVEMIMAEKADMIVFTGDLVNNVTAEVKRYIPIFNQLKAPLGVYSVLGNHDYGDYHQWSSAAARKQNMENMYTAHKELGWDLLLNEHRSIKVGTDKIDLIGVENWGAGRFAKYGDLTKAHQGTEADVKLLLSHDPSHWDAQVRPDFPDIDLMMAGHTHGFQFGVEIGDFQWSPSQYIYKQWAGLYQRANQQIYVNRGFGFVGYPGRIGIPPEITILELSRA
ncbi:MAG: metallophosphoesterase [Cyclobacteriaceae bacterium]|nr:metallophosphoesterase [Cyclobacteriaceae bacterium]MCH8517138.1 metallophosphoesterase [Cyclobacteriaceae bacterium]